MLSREQLTTATAWVLDAAVSLKLTIPRQLLRHRHKLVCLRTSVMNQLHARAMGRGLR